VDILIILGLILLNGVFAMSELAVVSSKRIRLQNLSDNGSRGATALRTTRAVSSPRYKLVLR
jgi:putative hemolysin